MKIKVIILFILFNLSNSAMAGENSLKDAVDLANNSLTKIHDTGSIKLPCIAKINDQNITLDTEFSSNGVDNNCFHFFTTEGTIGPWGNIILKSINNLPENELKKSYLSDNIPDMNYICPNFKNFSDDLKKKFWVWTFASIAWQESSCEANQISQGVNSKAVGLLQLEDSKKLREGRGNNCEVKSVTDPKNNLPCGVEILHQQLLGSDSRYFNTSTGELFWKSSYWQHLRFKKRNQKREQELIDRSQKPSDNKTDIKELVMRFPYCRQ